MIPLFYAFSTSQDNYFILRRLQISKTKYKLIYKKVNSAGQLDPASAATLINICTVYNANYYTKGVLTTEDSANDSLSPPCDSTSPP
ncbi:rCG63262 [Rattus norvegicus]|uniref:RCG63262 n=1 Tax=Rattus norvegicus TaxID=10116 RepID=A6JGS9_RAT|nr:rCG63262 [Rattus norvegicus]